MGIDTSFQKDIVCKRQNEGVSVNIPHIIVEHSLTGFEWDTVEVDRLTWL